MKFDTISPVDNSVYVSRQYADQAMIDNALQHAAIAQRDWQQVALPERQAVVNRFIELIKQQQATIAEQITWQMGRPISQAGGEVDGVIERATAMVKMAEQALQPLVIEQSDSQQRFIEKQPLGTVLVIAPWNYPFLTAINSIVPALLSGNSVILKHSSQTPLAAEMLQQLWQQAGLPAGVFQYLHLAHQATKHVLQHDSVQFVAFTGSVAAGLHVQQPLSQRFIGSTMELGGKDPAYVREDADIDFTAEQLVDGAFFNAGQSCCGIERIYVAQSVFDRFIECFVEKTKQLTLGNPTDNATRLGPVVSQAAADAIRQQINAAVNAGAKTLIDETQFLAAKKDSPYLAPQILVDVDHTMSIMRDETFGPVVGVMAVNDDQHALSLMNDSPYGLTASIWTRDLACAKQLGLQIETGTCFMNRCDYLDPQLAWTGVKDTGRGVSLSVFAFSQLTRLKSFYLRG